MWASTTGWPRLIACLKLQVIFRKRATNYRALLRKMTCEDNASYGSSPPCTKVSIFICVSYLIEILFLEIYHTNEDEDFLLNVPHKEYPLNVQHKRRIFTKYITREKEREGVRKSARKSLSIQLKLHVELTLENHTKFTTQRISTKCTTQRISTRRTTHTCISV